jgi:prepilin-type N-terminal cleavage/methylation domain-containing protein/prepilin-type processing-associated H-X9-DG protein
MKRRRIHHGFTLIELLVVIAVIAILAAILFPVFAQAREKARQAGCLSNLRQIAMAWGMYIQDHDETFPQALYLGNENGATCFYIGLHRSILPYMKNSDIWRCPANPTAVDVGALIRNMRLPPACASGGFPLSHLSYAYNTCVFRSGNPNLLYTIAGWPIRPVTALAELPYPAATTLLWDGTYAATGGPCTVGDHLVNAWHSGMTDVIWADGHVKAVKAAATGQTCGSLDGKAAPRFTITEAGPYQGKSALSGIPATKPDGSWELQCGP